MSCYTYSSQITFPNVLVRRLWTLFKTNAEKLLTSLGLFIFYGLFCVCCKIARLIVFGLVYSLYKTHSLCFASDWLASTDITMSTVGVSFSSNLFVFVLLLSYGVYTICIYTNVDYRLEMPWYIRICTSSLVYTT